jgi:hypothetical protein
LAGDNDDVNMTDIVLRLFSVVKKAEEDTISKQSHLRLSVAVSFLIYALLAFVGTWPLVTQINTHLPDRFNDALLHSWNTWWVLQALENLQFPYFTDYLFYPNGVSLATHNIAWFHILPSLVLAQFFNAITTYNLAVLFSLLLCGCVAFVLAYQLTKDVRAAFVAGLIYQMWPYRLARLDLPNLLATYWIPLFLLFVLYTINKSHRRYAILAGLCFALIGYTRWQLLIPATIMGLILFLFLIRDRPFENRQQIIIRSGLAAFSAAVFLLPAVWLFLNSGTSVENVVYEGDEETRMSADVLAYITPSALHPLFGDFTDELHDQYYFDRETTRRRPAYIGLIPFLLATFGFYYFRRQSWPWLTMAITLILLSFGPVLRIYGQFYEVVPTPYRLASPLGILELIRNPERFVMFVALPVAILAAYGTLGFLLNHRLVTKYAWLVIAILSLLILFEYFSPQTILRDFSNPSALYRKMASEQDNFAILNLPIDELKGSIYMYDQLVHQRPILQGNISRTPSSARDYINGNPWLSILQNTGEMSPEFTDVSRQLGNLAEDKIQYLVLHKDLVDQDRINHWSRYLLMPPYYEDEELIAYKTRPKVDQDFGLGQEWVPGLGPIFVDLSANCLHPNHVFVVNIGWGNQRTMTKDLDARITLVDGSGTIHQSSRFPLVEDWPTSEWPANTIAWGNYPIALLSKLKPGSYNVNITLEDSGTMIPEGPTHFLETVTIQPDICNLATNSAAVDANALFGDELRLVEYTVHQSDQQLDLALYWQAERFVDRDYTIFVHVYDQMTDLPAAQYDSRPHQGGYPTNFWYPGEIVEDRILIHFDGLPSGRYGIAIGVYDGLTGDRLPLLGGKGEQLVDDGRFILPDLVTISPD